MSPSKITPPKCSPEEQLENMCLFTQQKPSDDEQKAKYKFCFFDNNGSPEYSVNPAIHGPDFDYCLQNLSGYWSTCAGCGKNGKSNGESLLELVNSAGWWHPRDTQPAGV